MSSKNKDTGIAIPRAPGCKGSRSKRNIFSTIKQQKKTNNKWYGIRKGLRLGLFQGWNSTRLLVEGYPGAQFQGFDKREDAVRYLEGYDSKTDYEMVPRDKNRDSNTVVVYTDGACTGNGYKYAKMGMGVFFGKDDPRNVSEPVYCREGQRPSNNLAELMAIEKCLTIVDRDIDLEINTDSKYAKDMCDGRLHIYEKNGFRTAKGDPIKNMGTICSIAGLLTERRKAGAKTLWYHVPGHKKIGPNEMADTLAGDGAARVKQTHADKESADEFFDGFGGYSKRELVQICDELVSDSEFGSSVGSGSGKDVSKS
jgi:ribonuclease HI